MKIMDERSVTTMLIFNSKAMKSILNYLILITFRPYRNNLSYLYFIGESAYKHTRDIARETMPFGQYQASYSKNMKFLQSN